MPLADEDPQGYGSPFGGISFPDGISFWLSTFSWIPLQDETSLEAVEIDWAVSVLSEKGALSDGWIWQSPEFGLKIELLIIFLCTLTSNDFHTFRKKSSDDLVKSEPSFILRSKHLSKIFQNRSLLILRRRKYNNKIQHQTLCLLLNFLPLKFSENAYFIIKFSENAYFSILYSNVFVSSHKFAEFFSSVFSSRNYNFNVELMSACKFIDIDEFTEINLLESQWRLNISETVTFNIYWMFWCSLGGVP